MIKFFPLNDFINVSTEGAIIANPIEITVIVKNLEKLKGAIVDNIQDDSVILRAIDVIASIKFT
jgi:hypothetical protein